MPRASSEILARLLAEARETRDPSRLFAFLQRESRLPGPQANLGMVHAFAACAADQARTHRRAIWDLCDGMTRLAPADAVENTPAGFLPPCGAVALGALGAAAPGLTQRALRRLRMLAGDPRWRTREGAAMGVQQLLASHPAETLRDLARWIRGEDWLPMRAVAAAVAEPALLRNPAVARAALRLHRAIVDRVLASGKRDRETFRVLRQALGYSLSVVTVAVPDAGFRLLRTLAASRDPDGLWIVRENLRKHRLAARFPREVAALAAQVPRGTRR